VIETLALQINFLRWGGTNSCFQINSLRWRCKQLFSKAIPTMEVQTVSF